MTAKVVWLFVFVVLYWSYCIFWGIRGARLATTASDYFIAGRKLSLRLDWRQDFALPPGSAASRSCRALLPPDPTGP